MPLSNGFTGAILSSWKPARGDDTQQEVSPWFDGVLLNRLSRFAEHKSNEVKVLVGDSYSEYLRCIYDSVGNVSGCVHRSLAVMTVASFHNAQYRDGPAMAMSHVGLGDLVIRRHGSEVCALLLESVWRAYWLRGSSGS